MYKEVNCDFKNNITKNLRIFKNQGKAYQSQRPGILSSAIYAQC